MTITDPSFLSLSVDRGYTALMQEILEPREESKQTVYDTPYGAGSYSWILKKADIHPNTLKRRCESKKYPDWRIIKATDTATMEDLCPVNAAIDDMIFKENCWLVKVERDVKDVEVDPNTVIHYEFAMKSYAITLNDWENGLRPHKD